MSKDKVVKRPARGYHKFRNGLLNVTPKGGEKEIAKVNQQSPLLRLPPEVRNAIWKLALGGKVYRSCCPYGFQNRLMSPANDPTGIALIRVCRQIYAEAAETPLLHSIFSFENMWQIKRSLKVLNKCQRAQVKSLHIEIGGRDHEWRLPVDEFIATCQLSLPKYLPGLEEVIVRMFSQLPTGKPSAQAVEDMTRRKIDVITLGMLVNIRVDQTTLAWKTYDDSFKGIARNN